MRFPLSCLLTTLLFPLCTDAGSIRSIPQQHRTIQSAINAAKTGDTVLVAEGVYFENLRVSKNIVLASRFILDHDTTHISRTVIDGSRARDKKRGSTIHVFGPTDTTCVIFGLTIRGGTGSYAILPGDRRGDEWMVGGGIYVQRAGIRIAYNHITGNILRKTGTVENTSGAGIGCFEVPPSPGFPPYIIVDHNLVTRNTATGKWARIAGIGVQGPGRIQHNVVMHNRVTSQTRNAGGGIGLVLGKRYDLFADGNYVRYNVAGVGAGIQVSSTTANMGRAIIVNNIIADNEAFEVGGGIETTENSCALIINNTIVGNRSGSYGDGVIVTSGGTVTLINNILWRNRRHQVFAWTNVRLVNNLIDGGALGTNIIDADPLFVQGDSLFRLSPESPAIGTGTSRIVLGGSAFALPTNDFFGTTRARISPAGMSMGAIEPQVSENSHTEDFRRQQEDGKKSRLRLAFFIRQVGPPVFSADSLQLVQAGRITFQVVENDTTTHQLEQNKEELTFTLPPESNFIECEFKAQGLNEFQGLTCIVQLEGHDQFATVHSRYSPYVYRRYANLLPGTYHLMTSAGDETGFIDKNNGQRITIIVLPYWYQRWWAYVLLILTASGFAIVVYSHEVSRLRREKGLQQELTQKQIESQEAERKRLASELHDGLGQDLLVANNELQQVLADGSYRHDDIQHAADLVMESIESVREISANLHPRQIERLGFCTAVNTMVDKLSHSAAMDIQCRCDQVDDAMTKEAKIHVYRIIQESLTNIVKHSEATAVSLEIRRNQNHIEITIEDNGKGFDTEGVSSEIFSGKAVDVARGFGVASMTERARIVGGTLTIGSQVKRGTTVRLTLPVLKG